MKEQVRLGFLLTVLLVLLGLPSATASGAVRADILSDKGDRIVLEYTIEGFHSRGVSIGGEEYLQVWIPDEPVSLEQGAPALPHVNRSIIIPDDAEMAVTVLSAAYEERAARIAPSKGPLPRTIDPETVPFEFGAAYGVDAFHPGPLAGLGEPYIMRDHRGLVVQVNPYQYNPVTSVLRVYTRITLEVVKVGPGRQNVLERGLYSRAPVRAFGEIYRSHFLNFAEESFYDTLDEEGDMLIICHDPWIGNMDSFVAHKSSMGISATVVGVSTIGNNSTLIMDYIQGVYDTSDLAFVLLVGDAAEVATPFRQVGIESGAADPLYSKLAGNDDYPEILVGRFSASNTAQLDTQVQRTIDYENLPATEEDWFWRGTGIASSQGTGIGDEGQSDTVHMSEIRDWLLGAGYTHVDEIYDPVATDQMVTDAVNAGRGIINYTGHGSATGWGTTGFNNADVNALVNDNMLPFIVSVACNNGEFHHYATCFAEAWLRATNGSAPTGAIGMYASSVSQSWAPPMEGQDEFNLLLTDPDPPYSSFGTYCFAGSSSMMDNYGGAGVEMFDTWIVFGDPSLRIIGSGTPSHGLSVSPEAGMASSGPAGGPCSPASVQYTLRNRDDTPLDYEVTWAEPWLSSSRAGGTLAGKAATAVTFTLNDAARNLDHGLYTDTVQFINLTNHDGDTTRPVSLTVGSMATLGSWNFEADPAWSTEGEWEFGVPSGRGGSQSYGPDPTSGATGSTVYGVNLGGDFVKAVGPAYYLTAGPLDLTGIRGVNLTFQRWLNAVGMPEVAHTIDVSGNGSIWTNVWASSDLVADAAWTSQTFDISAVADGQASVYLRWGYQVHQHVPKSGSGWNLDDVMLEGIPGSARIVLTVDEENLSWTAVTGAISYDVVRGDGGILHDSGGDFTLATEACLGDEVAGTILPYTGIPGPGQVYWILVRGVSASGPMTYQTLAGHQVGVRDEEIATAAASCP